MSVYGQAGRLPGTIDSVLGQSFDEYEFIIVDDGSNDGSVADELARYASSDSRVRLMRQENTGLTVALSRACAAAEGTYLARIDAGDAMFPNRLMEQREVLDRHQDCVLVTSGVAFYGPDWEPLWRNSAGAPTATPIDALASSGDGLAIDIPHHGSVMIRRSAYERAGGYRAQFYYGQDWDLWYRLAEHGTFSALPEVLYKARLFPESISMLHAQRQREIAACSLGARRARVSGKDEMPWLEKAAGIQPAQTGSKENDSDLEAGNYFIGEALRRNRDPRCRDYFHAALRARPVSLRSWARLLQSQLLPGGNS